jgi:hypothetical protein
LTYIIITTKKEMDNYDPEFVNKLTKYEKDRYIKIWKEKQNAVEFKLRKKMPVEDRVELHHEIGEIQKIIGRLMNGEHVGLIPAARGVPPQKGPLPAVPVHLLSDRDFWWQHAL